MTTFGGPIPRQVPGRGEQEDRRSKTLPTAWLIGESQSGPPRGADPLRFAPDNEVPLAGSGPVLVMLSENVPATIRALEAAVRCERRAYVLAPPGWEPRGPLAWLAAASPTAVLVRRVRQPPAAMVLSGGSGHLWAGPSGPGPWRLRLLLDGAQASAATLAFLRLFWLDAEDEAWPHDGGLCWRPRGEAPFGVPPAGPSSPVRLSQGVVDVHLVPDGSTASVPSGRVPAGAARRLWLPPSGDGHDALGRARRAGTECVWSEAGLPPCVGSPSAQLMASSGAWSLSVTLSMAQAAVLDGVLASPASASFAVDVGLDELERALPRGRVWLAGRPTAEPLRGEDVLDIGSVRAACLTELPAARPPRFPAPHPLALGVRWTWMVDVPRAPSEASDDPLVKAWGELDAEHERRRAQLRGSLDSIEARAEAACRAFEELRGAALGFSRSRLGLVEELDSLSQSAPSAAGPEAARQLIDRLSTLEAQVEKLVRELEEAERLARESRERARQRDEHDRAKAEAQSKKTALQSKLESERRELARVEQELGALASPDEGPGRQDRRARQSQLRDERRRREKDVQRLDQALYACQQTLDEPFSFRPPAAPPSRALASSFVPRPRARAFEQVPTEPPPRVGRLLVAARQRYLAISMWEELATGEGEAARLGARLVADREQP